MSSANEQQNSMAFIHSQSLAGRILALAGAFESKNTNSINTAQSILIKTLLTESKIGIQRIEQKKDDDVIGGVSKMALADAGEVKDVKKSVENGARRRIIVSRGIMAGGCVVS